MLDFKNILPAMAEQIRLMMDTIVANIVLIGQIPAPTFDEAKRVDYFMQRLVEFQVDECTTDGYRNPIGIIRGTSHRKPPIFVVSRMDTPFSREVDHHFTVKQNLIAGTGLLDNSVGVGVLASLPEIFRRLNLKFESDIVLAGVIQSIGKGNLRGIRHLLKTWSTPIRGAVCIESGELGRLNYLSDGMTRCEVICNVKKIDVTRPRRFQANAILILNEVINQILELRLPLKPRSKIIFGKIAGGLKHGEIAQEARLGLEIQSDSDDMVTSIYNDIKDIVNGIAYENDVEVILKTFSTLRAARLSYNHPLVKCAVAIMEALDIEPLSEPIESELSIFLSHKIPALTLGITRGEGYLQQEAMVRIEPIFKGIAQIIGAIMAIDSGVCDE